MGHMKLSAAPKLLVMSVLTLLMTVTAASAFTDTATHWARDSIERWSEEYQIINGYSDGTFRPDTSITRGAFAGILNRLMHYKNKSNPNVFNDTAGSYWEDDILRLHAAAVYMGTNGNALVQETLTRQQAVSMIARAFDVMADSVYLDYEDADQISSYARSDISAMADRGYLDGVADARFRPNDPITRAEIVKIFDNLVGVLIMTPAVFSQDVNGNLMINSEEGANIQDMSIAGELFIAAGVSGPVTLTNVSQTGRTVNLSRIRPTILKTVDNSASTDNGRTTDSAASTDSGRTTSAATTGSGRVTPVDPEDEAAANGGNVTSGGTPAASTSSAAASTSSAAVTTSPAASTSSAATTAPAPSGSGSTTSGGFSLPANQLAKPYPYAHSPAWASDVYSPSPTTGGYFSYGSRMIPIYARIQSNQLGAGVFRWNNGRIIYVGTKYRTTFGVDVSSYQNNNRSNGYINWTAAKNDGVQFAMIRVAYRGYGSTGVLSSDKYYARNIDGAMAAGIMTGAYVFATARTVEEAIKEADLVIANLRSHPISGPVAYDWEINGTNYRNASVSKEMATACAVAFCERVKAAGYTPMVYISQYVGYVKYDMGALRTYLKWYPQYPSRSATSPYPTFRYQVDVWQFSDGCRIDGIGNVIDSNIWFWPK